MENQYLSRKQREFLRWEVGVCFHFGIRTYYTGHEDWDRVRMPVTAFNPKELDCRQWVRTAKEAGAKYCVLTAKHYDGFTLWPSKTTRYGVHGSMYQFGKGDIVGDYVKACRKYNMKVGLYYALAQWGRIDTKQNPSTFIGPMLPEESINPAKYVGRECSETDCTDENYDDYIIAQLTELLTNYGRIDYLWLDWKCPTHVEYNIQKIKEAIFKLQPGVLLFADSEWDPDVFWIGNENAYVPEDNKLCPAECNVSNRTTWFWTEDERTIKSSEVLNRLYRGSVGKGCNLLLNVPPAQNGLLSDKDRTVLRETGLRNGHFVFNFVWRKNIMIIGIAVIAIVIAILRSIYVDKMMTQYVYKLVDGRTSVGQYTTKRIGGLDYAAIGPGFFNFFNDPTNLAVYGNDNALRFDDKPIGRLTLTIKPRKNRTCREVMVQIYEFTYNPMGDTIVTKNAEVKMIQAEPGRMVYVPSPDTGAEGMELYNRYGYLFETYMQAAIEMWDLEADE